jgi:hypothetical protein
VTGVAERAGAVALRDMEFTDSVRIGFDDSGRVSNIRATHSRLRALSQGISSDFVRQFGGHAAR